ncbi:MAG: SET domain-containing protein-lysine N-methyltransferase [Verrucomicrobia bacterium]|nr:SET domain-containing protein-lysine N-methyltransferase [Verrucomicrobiota bacterium]
MRASKTTYRAARVVGRIASRSLDASEPRIVAVRDSAIHGQGLFARTDLPGRRKLGQLSGCLVRLPFARKTVESEPAIYLVELSRRYALDCREGNAFKHLNHSCEPNCYLRIIRRVVEVYTLKQIKQGTELTIDYGLTPHKEGMGCQCGSRECRRRI